MIDRPDTPHADVLLEGIWEDEVTPDDLASRALSAAQASSYAFRVASEGTTATAQLGEVDVADFLESETGKWAQGFIGIVRVGESLVHVSHALGELARSLQQVNLEQSEIVYQVEAEIEATQRQSAQAGVDPAGRIAELIAGARVRAAEVAEKMAAPETSSTTKKPSAGLVSGFMAFGRVPGASAEATERNGRVARNGHARNGYAVRNTRTEQNGSVAEGGRGAAHGHAATNGHGTANGHAAGEPAAPVEKDAAAAAQDAFANSADDTSMDLGSMGFGRTPSTPASPADDASAAPLPGTGEEEPATEDVAAAEPSEADVPVIANGFLGLGRAPSLSVAADDVPVPVVPQPLINGFMSLGRAPGADEPVLQGPSSGPIPVAAPTQFLPLPTTPAEIVAGELGEAPGIGLGTPMTLSGTGGGPSPESAPGVRADAMDDGFLSFGRVPSGGGWGGSGVLPTVPVGPRAEITDDAEEPAVDIVGADAEEDDDVADVRDAAVDEDGLDEPADGAAEPAEAIDPDVVDETDDPAEGAVDDEQDDSDVDFVDEVDAEADDLLAPDEQDEFEPDELDDAALADVDADLADSDEVPAEVDADLDDAGEPRAEADTDDEIASAAEDAEEADAEDAAGSQDVVPAETVDDVAESDDDDADTELTEVDEQAADEVVDEAAADEVAPEVAADEVDPDEPEHDAARVIDGEPEVDAAAEDATPADVEPETAEVAESAEEAPAEPTPPGAPEPDAPETDTAEPISAAAEKKPAFAAPQPVRKSGPVKFSDLLKAANAQKVDPAHLAPAALVASSDVAGAAPEVEPVAPAAAVSSAPSTDSPAGDLPADAAGQPTEPVKPAPVLATGPAILGRTEPLVLRKKVSPVVQQVYDAVASILGSLRGSPHGPDSGLHWAAGLLVKDAETIMAVTTSDAGWLPPGVVIPAGVRVLWNAPTGYRWASVDDPVRQLIEYAAKDGYTLTAVATTHPSRAYASVVGEENLVGVLRPGAVLPGGRSRLEATVSPARLQHIRSLDRGQAERQARALIRDLETQPIAPEHAVGIEAARIDARCFLDEHDEVPPAVLEQLHADERALGDALSLDRTPASAEDLTAPAPDVPRLRDRMLERAILVATLAAAYHDIESAVYAWTYARFLSSQDQDSKQAR